MNAEPLLLRDEVLENGVRLITEHNPHSMSQSIGLWVNVGSRDEEGEHRGASHFLEHLLFKGTHTRSASEISSVVENLGGYMNAFTDRDMTVYLARVRSKHQDTSALVLSDMLENSVIDARDVEMERRVILEEIKQTEDNPASYIHELYPQRVWKGCAVGRPVVGSLASISNMSGDAVREFYDTHYPGNLVAVATGSVDHERLGTVLVNQVGKGVSSQRKNRATPTHQSGLNFVERETKQIHLALSYPGVRYGQEDGAAMSVLSSYLGVGSSSKLFQEIREKRGLVYNIYSYNQSLSDAGIFTILAATSEANVEEVIRVVLGELEKVEKELTPDVLRTVKQKTIGMYILSSESSQRRMHQIGLSTLRLGKPRTVNEVVSLLEKVTVEDMVRVSKRSLDKDRLNLTALGMSQRDAEGLCKFL